MREENNFSGGSYNNPNSYGGFDNSPLAQISKMIGNIDINTLAQLLSNFNIQGNDHKENKVSDYESKNNKSELTEKKIKNNVENKNISKEDSIINRNEDVNEENNKLGNTEFINNIENINDPEIIDNTEVVNIDNEIDNNRREEIIKLLMCLRNLCDDKMKEEINTLIQIYSCN